MGALWFRAGLLKRERQQLVISRPLLGIAEDVMGTYELPESQGSIGIVWICVGVSSFSRLAKGGPQPLGIIVRKSTKQLIQGRHRRTPTRTNYPLIKSAAADAPIDYSL